MANVVLVKLGGSVITDIDRPNTAKIEEIDRMLNEIKAAKKNTDIVLGHGGGSFPHIPAHKYQVNKGLINEDSVKGAAITQHAAGQLHRIVIERAINLGLNPLSFAPSAGATVRERVIKEWNILPLEFALHKGFLPITYGDMVVDLDLGVSIVPTEEPLRYIGENLKPARVVIGGDTDGVFTSNPKLDSSARLIDHIDDKNIDFALSGAGASTKIDVTGGMRSKLLYLYNIAKETGASCRIVNVTKPGRLYSAIVGEKTVGTTIESK